ncbi:hypothetical protein B0J11DRAFT_433272 [Dendryphion nanum]|uniref:Fungal N-terminal domain-containing protein n=1 Tax=Dendryphion nanum TaxID=256645 RepID=A0A9P9DX71_9PLEO|nr:hypothetical protein B0J11DRAFT_433272 [Dendryphion nanum]
MEVVSVIASVFTLGEAAACLSSKLLSMAQTIRQAPREIAEIAGEVLQLSRSLQSIHDILSSQEDLCKAVLYEQLGAIIARFEPVKNELDKLTEIKKDSIRTRTRIKWLIEKPKAKTLLKTIESIKQALILQLSILQLANDVKRTEASKKNSNEAQLHAERRLKRSRVVAESVVLTNKQAIEDVRQADNEWAKWQIEQNHGEMPRNQIEVFHEDSFDTATWLYLLVFHTDPPPYEAVMSPPLMLQLDQQTSVEDKDFDTRTDHTTSTMPSRTSTISEDNNQAVILWTAETKPTTVVDKLLDSWTTVSTNQIKESSAGLSENEEWRSAIESAQNADLYDNDTDSGSTISMETMHPDRSISDTEVKVDEPLISNSSSTNNQQPPSERSRVRFSKDGGPWSSSSEDFQPSDYVKTSDGSGNQDHSKRTSSSAERRFLHMSSSNTPKSSRASRNSPFKGKGTHITVNAYPLPKPTGDSSKNPFQGQHRDHRSSYQVQRPPKPMVEDDLDDTDLQQYNGYSLYQNPFDTSGSVPSHGFMRTPSSISNSQYPSQSPPMMPPTGYPPFWPNPPSTTSPESYIPYTPNLFYTSQRPSVVSASTTPAFNETERMTQLHERIDQKRLSETLQEISQRRGEDDDEAQFSRVMQLLRDQQKHYAQLEQESEVKDVKTRDPIDEKIRNLEKLLISQQEEENKRRELAEAKHQADMAQRDVEEARRAQIEKQLADEKIAVARQEKKQAKKALKIIEENMAARKIKEAEIQALEDRRKIDERDAKHAEFLKEQIKVIAKERLKIEAPKLPIPTQDPLPLRRTRFSDGMRSVEVAEYSANCEPFVLPSNFGPSNMFQEEWFRPDQHIVKDDRFVDNSRSINGLGSSWGSISPTTPKTPVSARSPGRQAQRMLILPSGLDQGCPRLSEMRASLDKDGISTVSDDSIDDTMSTLSLSTRAEGDFVRSTILWQGRVIPSGSDLLRTVRLMGWKPIYARKSEGGQTIFLGTDPVHVYMFEPSYKPQYDAPSMPSASDIIMIGTDVVEEDALRELDFKFQLTDNGAYILDPTLTAIDIEALVELSFSKRENKIRRTYRAIKNTAQPPKHLFPDSAPEPSVTSASISTQSVTNDSDDQESFLVVKTTSLQCVDKNPFRRMLSESRSASTRSLGSIETIASPAPSEASWSSKWESQSFSNLKV